MEKSLVLRSSNANGTSYNGFQWPTSGPVECPDWDPSPVCGGGLHGLLWGEGNWSLLNDSENALWQVVEVVTDSIVKIDEQKVKFQRGTVVYSGNMAGAITMVLTNQQRFDEILKEIGEEAKKSGNKTTGYSARNASTGYSARNASTGDSASNASTGYYARNASTGNSARNASTGYSARNASTGDYARNASTGYYARNASTGNSARNASTGYSARNASTGNSASNASTGYYARNASTGDYARNASTGYSASNASTGDYARNVAKGKNSICVAAGFYSTMQASEGGCFAAPYFDEKNSRPRLLVANVGEDGILPNTPYRIKVLKSGKAKWEVAK